MHTAGLSLRESRPCLDSAQAARIQATYDLDLSYRPALMCHCKPIFRQTSNFSSLISECRFGDRRYSLEDTWNPDLGPPFGVMQCVHCECVPVSAKNIAWE